MWKQHHSIIHVHVFWTLTWTQFQKLYYIISKSNMRYMYFKYLEKIDRFMIDLSQISLRCITPTLFSTRHALLLIEARWEMKYEYLYFDAYYNKRSILWVSRRFLRCRHNARGAVPKTAFARSGSRTSKGLWFTVTSSHFEHVYPFQGEV